MTERRYKAILKGIEAAFDLFPAEIRRQERVYREEEKIRRAFGKLSLKKKNPPKKDRKRLPGKPLPEKVVSGKSEVTFQNPQFHKEIF